MMQKRRIDLLVLSDTHLGTYGCHAKELLRYLRTIRPGMVVLNGDIIDIWQFSKRFWPAAHMMVVKELIGWVGEGIPVYYITGNHDELLRKFRGFQLGSLKIDNKLSLKLNNQRAWIFHGDVFDVVMQHSKWLARLGAVGYDTLILINRFFNFLSERAGKGKISLSKKVKNSVKSAVSFIGRFEATVCGIAAENNYEYVICGHIHEPCIKTVSTPNGTVQYLNSGDWIENLTALEFHGNEWKLYKYQEDEVAMAVELKPEVRQKEADKLMLAQFMSELKFASNFK